MSAPVHVDPLLVAVTAGAVVAAIGVALIIDSATVSRRYRR
jgi:hypothetical protein